MTYNNIQAPEATVFLIEEAFVTHKGNDYRFWVEHDLRDDSITYEFIDEEPAGDSFDWSQFDDDCRAMIENFDSFCEERNIEKL